MIDIGPVWFDLIEGNEVINNNAQRAASIQLQNRQVGGPVHGTAIVLCNEFNGNTLTNLLPVSGEKDGLQVITQNIAGTGSRHPGTVILGTVFRGNKVKGIPPKSIYTIDSKATVHISH